MTILTAVMLLGGLCMVLAAAAFGALLLAAR